MSFGSNALGSVPLGGLNVVSGNITLALSGTSSTASVTGVVSSQTISKSLSGHQSTNTVNSLETSQVVSEILTGIFSTETAGTVTTSQATSTSISGTQSDTFVDLISATQNTSTDISGTKSTEAVGVFTTSQIVSAGLTGVESINSVGDVKNIASFILTGVETIFVPCTSDNDYDSEYYDLELYAETSCLDSFQEIITTLSGVKTTAQLNHLDDGLVKKNLTSVSSNVVAGTFSTDQVVLDELSGVVCTVSTGVETAGQITSTPLSGVVCTVSTGYFSTITSTPLSGVVSTVSTGVETGTQNVSKELSGVISYDSVDSVIATSNHIFDITGVSTETAAGQFSDAVIFALTGVSTSVTLENLLKQISQDLTSVVSTGTITNIHVIGDFPEITGTSQNVIEYVPFTTSWAAPGQISSYELSTPIPGVELYSLGNTLYAAGKTSDVLERTIEYIDSNKNLRIAKHFADLPSRYHGITKYIPPVDQEKLFYVTVNYYDETLLETKTITNALAVEYNYNVSNQELKTAARKVPA